MLFVIVRGPSGAGKSTFINSLPENAVICSADHFWFKEQRPMMLRNEEEIRYVSATDKRPIVEKNGQYYFYDFDPTKLSEAHAWCFSEFLAALEQKEELIVLDNTNIKLEHFSSYERVAKLLGYEVQVHEFMPTTLEQLKKMIERNVHGCPAKTSLSMWYDFELHLEAIAHDIK